MGAREPVPSPRTYGERVRVRGGNNLHAPGSIMRRAQPWLTERARALRSSSPTAEAQLWARLRNRQLSGFKFVRQAPTESYFGDFVCREAKVIVEVDGATHSIDKDIEQDAARTAELERAGYRLMRISNAEVRFNIDGVLCDILCRPCSGSQAPRWGRSQ